MWEKEINYYDFITVILSKVMCNRKNKVNNVGQTKSQFTKCGID